MEKENKTQNDDLLQVSKNHKNTGAAFDLENKLNGYATRKGTGVFYIDKEGNEKERTTIDEVFKSDKSTLEKDLKALVQNKGVKGAKSIIDLDFLKEENKKVLNEKITALLNLAKEKAQVFIDNRDALRLYDTYNIDGVEVSKIDTDFLQVFILSHCITNYNTYEEYENAIKEFKLYNKASIIKTTSEYKKITKTIIELD